MKIIIGLGNPGERYAHTRHNVGFWVIDQLSQHWNTLVKTNKFQAKIGEGQFAQEKIILVKPQTYMNRSGEAVKPILDYWNGSVSDLLVVFDDLALAPAQIRVKAKGSSGGHRGVQNIIDVLRTSEFARLRIGIGATPPGHNTPDYVLSTIGKSDLTVYQEAIKRGVQAVECFVQQGADQAMNQFNSKE